MALRIKEEEEIFADDVSVNGDDDFEKYSDDDDASSDDGDPFRKSHPTRPTPADSEFDDDIDSKDGLWSSIDAPPKLETFLGVPGVKTPPDDPESASEVAKLFVGDDFLTFVTEETNRYRAQNVDKIKSLKKSLKWKDVTLLEMKKFMGLVLIMGHVKKETRDSYWRTDPMLETPIFGKTMSRDRFREIWRTWHFSNNEDMTPTSGRLFKLRRVVDHLAEKFNEVYEPTRELSLEETTVPWRGRLALRSNVAGNLARRGIMIRTVCESVSGYVTNFEIYSDSEEAQIEDISSVLAPRENLWHRVYSASCCNGVSASLLLLDKKIRMCGPIRGDRGVPADLRAAKLNGDEAAFRRRGDVLLQVWNDGKRVRAVSTIHSAEFAATDETNEKTGARIVKPVCLVDYDKYAKDVDRADRHLSYFSIFKKTNKWTKRVFIYLLNCALFNSLKVYNCMNSKKMKYNIFLQEVARSWIGDRPAAERGVGEPGSPRVGEVMAKRSPRTDHPLRLSMNLETHKLRNIVTNGKTKYPTRPCRVCASHKLRRETRYFCVHCNVPLHKGSCFERYHTLSTY